MEDGQSGLNGAVTLNARAAEQEIVQIPCLSLVVPTALMRAMKSLSHFVMGMNVVLVENTTIFLNDILIFYRHLRLHWVL